MIKKEKEEGAEGCEVLERKLREKMEGDIIHIP